MREVLLVIGACVSIAGCVKDPVSGFLEIPVPSAQGVYIVNEGNYGRGNSTLSYYDLETFQVYNNVYAAANHMDLGDVGTGMVINGNLGYIIVNNSEKIEVIDLRTNMNVGTIDTGPGTSPRRLAIVNDTLGLVTNLYDNSVGVVDLKAFRVRGKIAVGPNPDGIAVAAGRAFVANSGFGIGNTLSVIELENIRNPLPERELTVNLTVTVTVKLTVTLTVTVGENPGGVRVTPTGQVYVVCAGSYGDFSTPNDDTPAKIFVIDPYNVRVVDSIYLGAHASDIAINSIDGVGYVATTDSVLRIDTKTHRKTGVFLKGSFYAVGVEEVSGDVYLADPKNYTQPGTVYVYAATGQLRTSFGVGIIPGWFAFRR